MASARDVAQYILSKTGKITTWKLQKLVYYSQAWHLVWDEVPLFEERIEAWANGPVCPALYKTHRGIYLISKFKGADTKRLSETECSTVDVVVDHYGHRTGQQLSDLTHSEPPWRDARMGLSIRERGDREITHEAMSAYYESIQESE